jgi:hypothetical protein
MMSDMGLRRVSLMLGRLLAVAMREVGMVRRLFMLVRRIALRGFPMMVRGLFVLLGGLLVMVCGLLCHGLLLKYSVQYAEKTAGRVVKIAQVGTLIRRKRSKTCRTVDGEGSRI